MTDEEASVTNRFLHASFLLATLGRMSQIQAENVIQSAINISLNGDIPMVVGKNLFERCVEIGKKLK